MSNKEKIIKLLSSLAENGITTSRDAKNEILTNLKFEKEKIINKFDLVSRKEFEILKKIVLKQSKEIKKLSKKKSKR